MKSLRNLEFFTKLFNFKILKIMRQKKTIRTSNKLIKINYFQKMK